MALHTHSPTGKLTKINPSEPVRKKQPQLTKVTKAPSVISLGPTFQNRRT